MTKTIKLTDAQVNLLKAMKTITVFFDFYESKYSFYDAYERPVRAATMINLIDREFVDWQYANSAGDRYYRLNDAGRAYLASLQGVDAFELVEDEQATLGKSETPAPRGWLQEQMEAIEAEEDDDDDDDEDNPDYDAQENDYDDGAFDAECSKCGRLLNDGICWHCSEDELYNDPKLWPQPANTEAELKRLLSTQSDTIAGYQVETRLLQERIVELKQALMHIADLASEAQEDWFGVEPSYAPDWTHAYKSILEDVDEALNSNQ